MNSHLKGCLLIALSMVMFAFIGPFVRWINIPAHLLMLYVSVVTSIVYLSFCWIKKDFKLVNSKNIIFIILLTIIGLTSIYAYYKAFSLTTFANSVLLHYTSPIFAAIFAPIFLKERLEKITVIALLISLLGIYLVSKNDLSFSSAHLAGLIFALLSGITYGLGIILNKHLMNTESPYTVSLYPALIGLIMLSPFFVSGISLNANQIYLLVAYSVITAFALLIYLSGMKHVKAQHAGIIAYVEVAAVIIYGIIFFKETPTLNSLAGGLLILFSGGLILRVEAKRKNDNHQ